MTRASKPRTQPRIKGRFASASDAAWVASETKAQRENKIAATLPQKPSRDRFKDAAVKVRTAQKKAGTKGRRDSGARALAKATGRQVEHRTFRTAAKAKAFLDKLKGKKSKLAWWGVSARDKQGVLFAYQNPVGTVDRAANELDIAELRPLPDANKKPTDFKVKESVRSNDARITVSVLNLNPPKQGASNANKKQTAVGSRTRSKKPAGDSRDGSRTKNKPSGNRSRKLAATGAGKRTRTPSKRTKKH